MGWPFTQNIFHTLHELRGVSCVNIDNIQSPKQIISSRSFGKSVTSLSDLEEAISHYAAIASAKLRKHRCLASGLAVFLHTNFFNPNLPKYENSLMFPFPIPSCDTSYIISIAKKCLRAIYKQGYAYHKTGIILVDILSESKRQLDLITPFSEKNVQLMQTMDKINRIYGRETVFHCAEGIKRSWQLKRMYSSPCYTTRWSDILTVR
jgi:DNA polymerase V